MEGPIGLLLHNNDAQKFDQLGTDFSHCSSSGFSYGWSLLTRISNYTQDVLFLFL